MRRILSIVTFITLIVLVMSACTEGQASQVVNQGEEAAGEEVAAAQEPTQASEAPTEVPTEAPPEAPATDEVNTVEVSLTEYTIDMPATLPAGPTTFEIENIGSFRHNFEIEGQGIEEALATDLQADQSDTLDVSLQPGSYEVICPVSDHAERGMRLDLNVTEASTEGPAEDTASAGTLEPASGAY